MAPRRTRTFFHAAAGHVLVKILGCVNGAPEKPDGEATMAKVLNDIFLFFSTAAFVTGVVLAAASLLG